MEWLYPPNMDPQQRHYLLIYPAKPTDGNITLREVLIRTPLSIYSLDRLVRTSLQDGTQQTFKPVFTPRGPVAGGLNYTSEHYICTPTIVDALDLIHSRRYAGLTLLPKNQY